MYLTWRGSGGCCVRTGEEGSVRGFRDEAWDGGGPAEEVARRGRDDEEDVGGGRKPFRRRWRWGFLPTRLSFGLQNRTRDRKSVV